MKGRIFYSCLLVWLCFTTLTTHSIAQTVTSVTFPAVPVCPGSGITVTYTTSGTFTAGNVFTAYLSDISGVTYPTAIGTVARTTAGTISATIPATAANSSSYRIQVKPSSGTASVSLSQLTIAAPAAPGTTPPNPYCEGATASALVATASSGGTLNWYGTNKNGTASSTPTVPGTTASFVGTTLYYVSQTVNGCESQRISIAVTVTGKPNAPGTSSIAYCVGQTANALTATPISGGTLNWYGTNQTGGTASSVAPTPPTTSSGTSTYYVSQSLNGCESARASLAVTVNPIPAAPSVSPSSYTYCEGASATALTATGQNLRWYGTSPTGGSGSATPTVPNTAASAIGTNVYYVSQTVNSCESPRADISVVVRASPVAPATTPAPSYCQNQTATALIATASTGGTLNWYGANQTGGTASTTPSVPGTSQAGTVNYYVSQIVNGCESARAAIGVTVKPLPGAPGVASPLIACQNQAGYALTATPSANGILNWYGTSSTGGTSTSTPPALSTSALGSTTYYVSQSVNGCEGARAALTVTVNAVPTTPAATSPNAYCEGVTAQALSASGQNLRWYGTNATGGSFSGNATVPSTAASAIGTVTYYVSQFVSGCESARTGIPVQVKDTPNAPGTAEIAFCQGTGAPALTVSLVANATINWYGTNQTGGSPSATAPVPGNSNVGTTVYYVSQTLVGCEGPRASLPVRVKATPGAPGVNPISFCNNSQAQPLTANGTNLKWYDANDGALGGTPTPGTGTVGTQTFKVSQTTNEGCEGPKANLTVTINALPGLPNVSDVTYCQTQQDQPAQNVQSLGSSASGQNLKWYFSDGNQFPSAPIPSIDRAGTQVYFVSQTVNNCEGGRASIQVKVNTTSAPTTPKSTVTYCVDDKATPLEATGETGGQLRWIDPFGRLTTFAPTPFTISPNIQPNGDPFYVYQLGVNGCYSPRATIRVIVNTAPTLALIAPTATVNLGQRAPLQLKFTGTGPYSYTIIGGYEGRSRLSDTTISVLPRGNTTYQVVSVSNGCGVGLPGNPATAIISVRAPTVATSSLTASTLCAGTSLVVPFTTTGEFTTGNIFRIEMISVADTTKKFAIAATAPSSPVSGPLPLTLTSGQYYVRVKADNPEVGITGSNSPTLLTVRSLPSASLSGTQNIYEGTPVSLTFAFGGDGPWVVAYADSLRSYSATSSTTPYVVEARPARTTTYRLTSVTNSCGNGPLSGTAVITVLPLLGVDDNSLDPLVKAYPVPTETTLMVELNLPLTRDPAILSLTDLRGQPVIQQTTRSRLNELNLTSQPSGIYLLRIQVGDRQTVRKVLKQ